MVESAGDHRIAMAGAIAALAVRTGARTAAAAIGGGVVIGTGHAEPVQISGWDAVATSYPGFLDDLAQVAVPPDRPPLPATPS